MEGSWPTGTYFVIRCEILTKLQREKKEHKGLASHLVYAKLVIWVTNQKDTRWNTTQKVEYFGGYSRMPQILLECILRYFEFVIDFYMHPFILFI